MGRWGKENEKINSWTNKKARVAPFYPKEEVVFMPNFKSCFINPEVCTIIFEGYEIRTFGFSKCGKYMVACNSSNLSIFKRI